MKDSPSKPGRRYVRYNADLAVKIQQHPDIYNCRIKQISRGGFLAVPALPPDLPPYVSVSFHLSEDLPPITCKGEVIYSIGAVGTGILFAEISDEDMDFITGHFERQSAAERLRTS